MFEMQNYIDTLSDAEYEEFIEDFTEEQKAKIQFYFKPTKEDNKKMRQYIKNTFWLFYNRSKIVARENLKYKRVILIK